MRTLGYDVTLHKLLAFLVSCLVAGVAGLLYAWYNQFISPSAINITASTEGILMVVLGGVGTLLGPLLGAGAIVLVKNVLSIYVQRWPTIMGLIFIAVDVQGQETAVQPVPIAVFLAPAGDDTAAGRATTHTTAAYE